MDTQTKRPFARTLRLVWSCGRGNVAAIVIAMLVAGILPLVSLYLQKALVDGISATAHSGSARDTIVVLIGLLAGVEILIHAARIVGDYLNETQSQAVQDHVAGLIHEKSTRVDLAHYENDAYHDSIHRAQQEGPTRPALVVANLATAAQNAITLSAIGAFLLSFHWGFALLLLAAVIPGLVVRLHYSRKLFHWQRIRTSEERRAGYLHQLLCVKNFAKELRIFGTGGRLREWYRETRARVRSEKLKLVMARCQLEMIAQGAATTVIYFAYLLIAWRTIEGRLSLGDLVVFYQAFYRAQAALRSLLQGLAGLYENSLFLGNLYEFLDLESQDDPAGKEAQRPRAGALSLEVRNLTFRYPGMPRPAVEDVSLHVPPGQHVAIVGANGSGKTTFVKLLCRLYEPTSGSIWLGDTPAPEFETGAYRRRFSVLFQDYAQYDLSARDNIALGNPDSPPDPDLVSRAAGETGAADVIRRLPNQYETVLGRMFRDGVELSQGEWQKIALARALYADSSFVILDEPTSSMDPQAEYDLFQKINQLTRGRTLFLISHRLYTVRMADRIVVFDAGSIAETGTHDELIARGGLYARLYATQAQAYRTS